MRPCGDFKIGDVSELVEVFIQGPRINLVMKIAHINGARIGVDCRSLLVIILWMKLRVHILLIVSPVIVSIISVVIIVLFVNIALIKIRLSWLHIATVVFVAVVIVILLPVIIIRLIRNPLLDIFLFRLGFWLIFPLIGSLIMLPLHFEDLLELNFQLLTSKFEAIKFTDGQLGSVGRVLSVDHIGLNSLILESRLYELDFAQSSVSLEEFSQILVVRVSRS